MIHTPNNYSMNFDILVLFMLTGSLFMGSITLLAYQFIKLYCVFCYDNHIPFPLIDMDFICTFFEWLVCSRFKTIDPRHSSPRHRWGRATQCHCGQLDDCFFNGFSFYTHRDFGWNLFVGVW